MHRPSYRAATLYLLAHLLASGCQGAQPPDDSGPLVDRDRLKREDKISDLSTRAAGTDWPTFLGPDRNGKSSETGLNAKKLKRTPRIVWQTRLGESYGIGSVSHGRYVQFDRHGDQARATCYHAETGGELWRFEYPTQFRDLYGYNGGPRCSPVLDGNRVYLMGAEGMLHCLNATKGTLIWKCDTVARFGVVQNFFGVGSTPIIEDDLLIAIIGGSPRDDQQIPPGQLDRVTGDGSGIVAFDKWTGVVRYKLSDELAGYASPVVSTIAGRRWGFAFCRGGLVAFDPRTGEVDFEVPWRAKMLESVNASTPVVVEDHVFISETYGPGSCLLRVRPGGHDIAWQDSPRRRQKAFQAHWNTPIYQDGFLYGCSGRNPPDAELRCIEFQTGKIRWSVATGARSSLTFVDGYLINLVENGQLQVLRPNPERREIVAEWHLKNEPSGDRAAGLAPRPLLRYPCWAAPIVSHGLLYVRGADRLICLELM